MRIVRFRTHSQTCVRTNYEYVFYFLLLHPPSSPLSAIQFARNSPNEVSCQSPFSTFCPPRLPFILIFRDILFVVLVIRGMLFLAFALVFFSPSSRYHEKEREREKRVLTRTYLNKRVSFRLEAGERFKRVFSPILLPSRSSSVYRMQIFIKVGAQSSYLPTV